MVTWWRNAAAPIETFALKQPRVLYRSSSLNRFRPLTMQKLIYLWRLLQRQNRDIYLLESRLER